MTASKNLKEILSQNFKKSSFYHSNICILFNWIESFINESIILNKKIPNDLYEKKSFQLIYFNL